MRDERFALVVLGRAVRVDVVDVGEVGPESRREETLDQCGAARERSTGHTAPR